MRYMYTHTHELFGPCVVPCGLRQPPEAQACTYCVQGFLWVSGAGRFSTTLTQRSTTAEPIYSERVSLHDVRMEDAAEHDATTHTEHTKQDESFLQQEPSMYRPLEAPWPPPGHPPPLPSGWHFGCAQHIDDHHLRPFWYNVQTKQVSWLPPREWLPSTVSSSSNGDGAAKVSRDTLAAVVRGTLRWERLVEAWERCLPDQELLDPLLSCVPWHPKQATVAHDASSMEDDSSLHPRASSEIGRAMRLAANHFPRPESELHAAMLLKAVTRLQAAARGRMVRRRHSPRVRNMRAEEERRERHAYVTTHARDPEYRPIAKLVIEGSNDLISMLEKRRQAAEQAAIETKGMIATPRFGQPSPTKQRSVATLPVVLAPPTTGGCMPTLPAWSTAPPHAVKATSATSATAAKQPSSPEAKAYSIEAKQALERSASKGDHSSACKCGASAVAVGGSAVGISQGGLAAIAAEVSLVAASRATKDAISVAREWTASAISPAKLEKGSVASKASARADETTGGGSGGASCGGGGGAPAAASAALGWPPARSAPQEQVGASREDLIQRGMMQTYLASGSGSDSDDDEELKHLAELESAKAEGRARLVKKGEQQPGVRSTASTSKGAAGSMRAISEAQESNVIQDL